MHDGTADGGECFLIAAKTEALGVELAARVAEGGIDDVALRHDGQADQNIAVRMREHILHAVELLRLDGMQRAHGEHLAVGNVLLQQENRRRDDNRDNGNRRGHAVARTDFRKELLVDDDRQGVVVFANEHRRAIVGKRAHEHHQRAGEQRRHDERQNDLEDFADAGAAEAFARFNERVIHILKGAGYKHEHQRIQL